MHRFRQYALANGRRLLVPNPQSLVARERQRFAREAEELRRETLDQLRDARRDFEARILSLQTELEEARSDLLALRALNAKAQQQREGIWRELVTAATTQRDPTQPLH
jgi:hypothetical protein